MSEERPGYDAGGTVEVEIPVLLDLLNCAEDGVEQVSGHGSAWYRASDLRRRIMVGQAYVGVCDWPVEEVSNG